MPIVVVAFGQPASIASVWKTRSMQAVSAPAPMTLTASDAGELMTLQRAAYVTEAQLYGTPFLPALTETLDEVAAALARPALGIRVRGRLIGAIRWSVLEGTAHIGRLVVAPDLQGRGLGTTLLRSAENQSGASRFELFTGHRSVANIRLYEREGYERVREAELQSGVRLVYLAKQREQIV